MIEDALLSVEVTINHIADYVGYDSFKLFKLHGSADWGREVATVMENIDKLDAWGMARELIRKTNNIMLSNRFQLVRSHPIAKVGDVALFPAIAIPVETKRDFECPIDHLDCLRKNIESVKKILVVGWRATEQHFIRIMKENIRNEIEIQVVSGSESESRAVLNRIVNTGLGVKVSGQVFREGFTEYVLSREAENFFSGGIRHGVDELVPDYDEGRETTSGRS